MDLIGLIPSFGNVLYTVGAFIIALSVIVAVHEYGHYIVGRWCGIKAEVFSIGFGPVLYSRQDRHGTRWQVAALPFGGYVKFLGDAGAVSDKAADDYEELDEDTKRHTMHGAPLWARAATVAAGPVFNFILSILVFAAILMARGTPSDPLTIAELRPLPGVEQQLLPGDEVLSIAGREAPEIEAFDEFIDDIPVESALLYTVRRDGETIEVVAPYPFPPLVNGLTPGSAATEAGLQSGDVILSVEGTPLIAFEDLRDVVTGSGGEPLQMQIWRDGETFEVSLTPRSMDLPRSDGSFETRYLIGITGGLFFSPATETPGLGESLSHGVSQTFYIVRSSLSGLYHMAVGAISACNLSGPIGIAETSGAAASQGWISFIWFIAVLSTAVGLLNLFPIPVLDGGHLVFHAYEALAGRPPSDRALKLLMTVGLGLLLLLMAFALTNDLFCP